MKTLGMPCANAFGCGTREAIVCACGAHPRPRRPTGRRAARLRPEAQAPRDHSEGAAQDLLERVAAAPRWRFWLGRSRADSGCPTIAWRWWRRGIFGARAHRASPVATVPGFGIWPRSAKAICGPRRAGRGPLPGLKKLSLRGVAQDFLHLEYDGGGLYVPVYRIGVVHRFVGGTPETVRLDKLGGATWVEKRRRVSSEARKLAESLLQLYAQRRALPGHAFPPLTSSSASLRRPFPSRKPPTRTKHRGGAGRHADEAPMDRLVCGDVGYGKTEVALRASLLAALGGRQVAVLAPTTVLVEQHAVTFAERLRDFPVRVASLSRFRSKHEQRTPSPSWRGEAGHRHRHHPPVVA